MRTAVLKRVASLMGLWLVCASAHAVPVPYLLELLPGDAQWDPSADLLSIPSGHPSYFNLPLLEPPLGGSFVTGQYSLFMDLTPEGTTSGGVFTLFGSDADLGIATPTLLLAADVRGLSFGGPSELYFSLQLVYANPKFGHWAPQIQIAGDNFSCPFTIGNALCPPITSNEQELLSEPWVGGPPDYWVLTGLSVPEPATFGLMALGLAGLGFSRRKRRD